LAWQVMETPPEVNGRPVVLLGSDVFFTGREIFIGVGRRGGTNMEGAVVSCFSFSNKKKYY
jgi:hypothetical protein